MADPEVRFMKNLVPKWSKFNQLQHTIKALWQPDASFTLKTDNEQKSKPRDVTIAGGAMVTSRGLVFCLSSVFNLNEASGCHSAFIKCCSQLNFLHFGTRFVINRTSGSAVNYIVSSDTWWHSQYLVGHISLLWAWSIFWKTKRYLIANISVWSMWLQNKNYNTPSVWSFQKSLYREELDQILELMLCSQAADSDMFSCCLI